MLKSMRKLPHIAMLVGKGIVFPFWVILHIILFWLLLPLSPNVHELTISATNIWRSKEDRAKHRQRREREIDEKRRMCFPGIYTPEA